MITEERYIRQKLGQKSRNILWPCIVHCLDLLKDIVSNFHAVHGILKARILKWFAISFSSGPCFVGHGIQSHHLMVNRWGNKGNSVRLYFLGAPKSLQMVAAAMKLKGACTLEEKL